MNEILYFCGAYFPANFPANPPRLAGLLLTYSMRAKLGVQDMPRIRFDLRGGSMGNVPSMVEANATKRHTCTYTYTHKHETYQGP